MNNEALLPGDGRWDVRLQSQDPSRGLYSVVLHDPESWATVGPYHLAFATPADALRLAGTLRRDRPGAWSAEMLNEGAHVQDRAHAPVWQGILTTLEHCAHLRTAVKSVRPTVVREALPDAAAESAAEGWTRLTEFVAALVALTDGVVVVAASPDQYGDGNIYVQLCREDDGALTLEAVSHAFLNPPLPQEAIVVLHELGWEDPTGEGLPNYTRYLGAADTAPGDVAAFLVTTLRDAYGVNPDDRLQFAPEPLVESLLRGDFGPRFMLDLNMPEDRKARHYLSFRFPSDLA